MWKALSIIGQGLVAAGFFDLVGGLIRVDWKALSWRIMPISQKNPNGDTFRYLQGNTLWYYRLTKSGVA